MNNISILEVSHNIFAHSPIKARLLPLSCNIFIVSNIKRDSTLHENQKLRLKLLSKYGNFVREKNGKVTEAGGRPGRLSCYTGVRQNIRQVFIVY